ncbi:hypothetical protein [Virgibacillus phasianinus]|nr:hypothetical protein [Virgibacillus phasianinus]
MYIPKQFQITNEEKIYIVIEQLEQIPAENTQQIAQLMKENLKNK